MGNCISSASNDAISDVQTNKAINKQLKEDEKRDRSTVKLLLLGKLLLFVFVGL